MKNNILSNKKSRLLVLNNPFVLAFKKKGVDCYSLIGGTIENNELPEETLIRETKEESGIKISKQDFKFINKQEYLKEGVAYERNYFLLSSIKWNFKVIETDKFESIQWIDFYDNKSKFKKSDQKIISMLFKEEL